MTTEPEADGFSSWASCEIGEEEFCFGEHEGVDATQKIVFKRGISTLMMYHVPNIVFILAIPVLLHHQGILRQ